MLLSRSFTFPKKPFFLIFSFDVRELMISNMGKNGRKSSDSDNINSRNSLIKLLEGKAKAIWIVNGK